MVEHSSRATASCSGLWTPGDEQTAAAETKHLLAELDERMRVQGQGWDFLNFQVARRSPICQVTLTRWFSALAMMSVITRRDEIYFLERTSFVVAS